MGGATGAVKGTLDRRSSRLSTGDPASQLVSGISALREEGSVCRARQRRGMWEGGRGLAGRREPIDKLGQKQQVLARTSMTTKSKGLAERRQNGSKATNMLGAGSQKDKCRWQRREKRSMQVCVEDSRRGRCRGLLVNEAEWGRRRNTGTDVVKLGTAVRASPSFSVLCGCVLAVFVFHTFSVSVSLSSLLAGGCEWSGKGQDQCLLGLMAHLLCSRS